MKFVQFIFTKCNAFDIIAYLASLYADNALIALTFLFVPALRSITTVNSGIKMAYEESELPARLMYLDQIEEVTL